MASSTTLTKDQIAALLNPWFSDLIFLLSKVNGILFFGTYSSVGAYGLSLIVTNTLNRWIGTYRPQFYPAGVQFKYSPTIKSVPDRTTWRQEYGRLTSTLPGILNTIGVNAGIAAAALKILNDLYQYINIDPVANAPKK